MNETMQKIFVRVVMIIAWVGIIFLFLFLPKILPYLYPTESRSINLYVAPLMIDSKTLAGFQEKTGIKVYMNYYESNEELLQKLYVTGGKGYDLVMPVDYVINLLREKELIQKLDHTKLNFWHRLRPSLLHYYYDISNEYSIPYFLSIYGLGIDTTYFGSEQPEPTWKLLFERQPRGYDVAITDVPRRAIAIAGYYLYGTDEIADEQQLKSIEQLLINQKKWVRMYTDVRAEDLLATKNCPVVMTIASDLWMIKREYPNLEFKVPEEGTFVSIDSFVIPKTSTKQDLVYEFLNYLYQPDIMALQARRYGFCPPVEDADIVGAGIFCPTQEQIKKFHFFRNSIPEKILNDMWISIMSH